jgi:protein phosphatase
MTPSSVKFVTGVATDRGRVRAENEDSFLAAPAVGLWAIADGMGGHAAGRLASQVIVSELETVARADSAANLLAACEAAIQAANARMRTVSAERGGIVIGSTLVVLLMFDSYYACIWSGDSRLYLIRDNKICQLTTDHNEAEELFRKGALTAAEAARWPRRNVITRAIGIADILELDVISGGFQAGDAFLLCSDGLTAHLANEDLLSAVLDASPQMACDLLTAKTLERGGTDNVTIVIVGCVPVAPTVVQPKPPPIGG